MNYYCPKVTSWVDEDMAYTGLGQESCEDLGCRRACARPDKRLREGDTSWTCQVGPVSAGEGQPDWAASTQRRR
jgi:hypothetical protein